MENFVVSARKYRPKGFEEVVGQDHITTTLQNAINDNHLAQALLFCGPRGVGKTTCARIVAKVINEVDMEENENSLNIFELDAASNNSVEHIRNLTDQVRYPPQFGKYKVYIIDEVHMLSNAAFNAFLKTLEEPPAYAIFILATTEKHKVIPTILSRCQIFDFNRIGVGEIVDHLKVIAEKEQLKAEEAALHLIAQKSDGALRDALSMFDLISTFSSDQSITYASTIKNLHILDYDYYFKLTDQLLSQDVSNALNLFDEILKKGFDGHNFISGLGLHFRNLMVAKDASTHELLEEPDQVKARYIGQSEAASASFLLSAINICTQADIQYKANKNQRLLVELALMKMAHIPSVLDLDNYQEERKKKLPEIADQDKPEKKKVETDPVPEVTAPPPPVEKESAQVLKPTTVPSKEPTDAEPKIEKVKGSLKRTGKMPSIPDLATKVSEETIEDTAAVEENESLQTEDFSLADVTSAWDEFKTLNKGKAQIVNVLNQPFELSDDHKNVIVQLSNPVQLDILTEIRSDLMIHLKAALKNDTVLIDGVVNKEETKEMLYTNNEKFQHLAKSNPLVKSLQEKMGLDPDY